MKKKLFLDTNVILDFLGERDFFYAPMAKIATLADKNLVSLVVSPISFATLSYLLSKFESPEIAREKLRKFKVICQVCSVDEHIIEKGLNSSFNDFEDALQYLSALDSECQFIITRNGKDFKKSAIPVMTADEFLASIKTN